MLSITTESVTQLTVLALIDTSHTNLFNKMAARCIVGRVVLPRITVVAPALHRVTGSLSIHTEQMAVRSACEREEHVNGTQRLSPRFDLSNHLTLSRRPVW